MAQQNCIFCKIGNGQVHADILYRDGTFFAIRDINPVAPVHLLVIPFAHVETLVGQQSGQLRALGQLFVAVASLVKQQGLDAEGYRLTINQGRNAGQDVPHLHLHLLGGKSLEALG